jgi:hypothetical protein
MRLSPIFSLRISRPCFLASAPYLRQRYDDLQIMEARGVAWSRSSPGLLDAHRFAGDGGGRVASLRRRGDQSGENVVQQELGALERRSQVVRVRSGFPIDPVAAGDQALHEESQFDLHRREDVLRSRAARAHATFLPSPVA